jgi:hypothetical protein
MADYTSIGAHATIHVLWGIEVRGRPKFRAGGGGFADAPEHEVVQADRGIVRYEHPPILQESEQQRMDATRLRPGYVGS